MGMGEPFDNYVQVSEFLRQIHDPKGIGLSYRNITLSTCGLVPYIERFAKDFPQVNLAVSLHAATQEEREKIMPVAKAYPLNDLIPACRQHAQTTGRRVTFEYALIKGQNDSQQHCEKLAALLKGMNCHVNLIPLNPVTESGLSTVSREAAHRFAQSLENLGIPCTVRRQLGADIDAACGQLRKKHTCSKADE
jgi:23S rRNA (adenine2503-C2)-methyltransferase